MALFLPPPSKAKFSQFHPLRTPNINPNFCTITKTRNFSIIHYTRRTPTGLEQNCIKRAAPIVCAAAVPFPGGEKDQNFGTILLSDVVVKRKRNVFVGRKWNSLDVATLGVVLAMHILCLFAPYTFNWGAFCVAVSLYVITGLLGITLSFHRNLSHRSFKLPKWLEYIFAYCGVQALQRDPIFWVSTHRYHHQYCDTERDPHSPIEGFWFSHMSWLFDTKAIVEKCGESNNVGDLEKQPFYKFLEKSYIVHPIALGALLYAVGGFPYIVWGMGWHNNHHAFEYSARHGLERWQIDMTWWVVTLLQAIGLATDVKLPTALQKQKMAFLPNACSDDEGTRVLLN